MFESGSYKSLLEHVALYKAPDTFMERANRDEFLVEKDKSRKRPWKTSDTREAPSSSSKQKSVPHSEQPIKEVLVLGDVNVSDSEDTDTVNLPKIKTRPDWLKAVPEEDRHETPEPDWIGKKKLSKADLEGPAFKVFWSFHDNNHSLQFHMEECHLLLTDHVDLINLEGHQVVHDEHRHQKTCGRSATWDRKLSNETQSHSTRLDTSNFLFKQDYTIVSKPKAIIYKDRIDQKRMMREAEMHKFSDGTFIRILEKLDHMVKDFKLFKYNPGIGSRIWSEDDRRRSKYFMEVIERRLKIKRIFWSLESFVSGRLRDVDYRLIQRTE
nr:hypothetical protein [Tanacetum cinerariifolium]